MDGRERFIEVHTCTGGPVSHHSGEIYKVALIDAIAYNGTICVIGEAEHQAPDGCLARYRVEAVTRVEISASNGPSVEFAERYIDWEEDVPAEERGAIIRAYEAWKQS